MKWSVLGVIVLHAAMANAQGWPPRNGASLPTTCASGESFFLSTSTALGIYRCTATDTWSLLEPAAESQGGLPAGVIVFVDSGTCPTGFTEVAGLNDRMVRGTVNASGDVGQTGGSDSVTPTLSWPAGVPTATGAAVADHASHTHTYNQVINHTHAVTSVGSAATGSTTNLTGASDTSSTTATAANPAGGVATGTTAGPSATLTHSVTQPTIAWPAGVPTSTAIDTKAAYVNLIGCRKD